jgi:uncharacterized protein (UPF0332 family)
MEREYGRMLSIALRERSSGTYGLDFDISFENVESSVSNAERFLARARSIINTPGRG